MTSIFCEKLYRYEQKGEHMSVAVPLKEGRLYSTEEIRLFGNDWTEYPVQVKVTSRYKDHSIRFLFVRFRADLPANDKTEFRLFLDQKDLTEHQKMAKEISASEYMTEQIKTELSDSGIAVDTGKMQFSVKNYGESLIETLTVGERKYRADQFSGPVLVEANGDSYEVEFDKWELVEEGPLCVILKAEGTNRFGTGGCEEGKIRKFVAKITAFAGKSMLDVSYRLINTSEEELKIGSLVFSVNESGDLDLSLNKENAKGKIDSTGCLDVREKQDGIEKNIYHTVGIGDLSMLQEQIPVENVRTCAGSSNYRTDFYIGRNGSEVEKIASKEQLKMESNEQMSEVNYGTFFADRTDALGGLSATIFQAQQNFPKAVKANGDGIAVYLVPEGIDEVTMKSGMSREQKFELYFHEPELSLIEIDNRSLIYQMPNRPVISPKDYRKSGAVSDVFMKKMSFDLETNLIGRADGHMRCFGMMNWGDTIDMNYTTQGRGGGKAVWSNNEYDFPHACALLYFRTGIRRFMDYCLVHASHWMDVDVCHYSKDPLLFEAQIEHTAGHVLNGVAVPSHQWVEGLLDYYHLTGDERGLETAIGIGDNILRLLETEAYQKTGEANARETGWALRSLSALYAETYDEKWLAKCDWIVGHFEEWRKEYGGFVAPYTDNTLIHVGFMISVAVGSLMRYYRIFPSESLKDLILSAVNDIRDHCVMDCGLFYYKELPSLSRLGNNTLLLESMAVGYELTGEKEYLELGLRTYFRTVCGVPAGPKNAKTIIEDSLVYGGESTKGFGQSFYPLAVFGKCLEKEYGTADADRLLKEIEKR